MSLICHKWVNTSNSRPAYSIKEDVMVLEGQVVATDARNSLSTLYPVLVIIFFKPQKPILFVMFAGLHVAFFFLS